MDRTSDNTIYVRSSEKLQSKNEFSGDFILPDSYEDIKRILYTSCQLRPERCEIASGKLANEGRMFFKVLFEDDNGQINSVDFSMDYQMSCPVEKNDGQNLIMSSPMVENLAIKLLNPRKVSIRAAIDNRCKLWSETPSSVQMPEAFTAEDRLTVERREEKLNQLCVMTYSDSDREVSEDIELDRNAEAIDEILLCEVNVNVNDVRRQNDSLSLRGEVDVLSVYKSGEGGIAFKNAQLPFSQSIDAPGAPENAVYIANVYIDKKSAMPAENAFGENKIIELDFSYSITVNAVVPCESEVTKDAYSTVYGTKNELKTIKYSSPMPNFVYSDTGSVEGEVEGATSCLCLFSDASMRNTQEGGYEAVCKFTAIIKNENGSIGVATLTDVLPLEINDCSECVGDVYIKGAQCAVDNGKIRITYSYSVNALCWQNCECTCVSAVQLTENNAGDDQKAITVYYPAASESLWDVAKKYHVSESMLMSYNMINDPREQKKVLLIPKKKKSAFSKII